MNLSVSLGSLRVSPQIKRLVSSRVLFSHADTCSEKYSKRQKWNEVLYLIIDQMKKENNFNDSDECDSRIADALLNKICDTRGLNSSFFNSEIRVVLKYLQKFKDLKEKHNKEFNFIKVKDLYNLLIDHECRDITDCIIENRCNDSLHLIIKKVIKENCLEKVQEFDFQVTNALMDKICNIPGVSLCFSNSLETLSEEVLVNLIKFIELNEKLFYTKDKPIEVNRFFDLLQDIVRNDSVKPYCN